MSFEVEALFEDPDCASDVKAVEDAFWAGREEKSDSLDGQARVCRVHAEAWFNAGCALKDRNSEECRGINSLYKLCLTEVFEKERYQSWRSVFKTGDKPAIFFATRDAIKATEKSLAKRESEEQYLTKEESAAIHSCMAQSRFHQLGRVTGPECDLSKHNKVADKAAHCYLSKVCADSYSAYDNCCESDSSCVDEKRALARCSTDFHLRLYRRTNWVIEPQNRTYFQSFRRERVSDDLKEAHPNAPVFTPSASFGDIGRA